MDMIISGIKIFLISLMKVYSKNKFQVLHHLMDIYLYYEEILKQSMYINYQSAHNNPDVKYNFLLMPNFLKLKA